VSGFTIAEIEPGCYPSPTPHGAFAPECRRGPGHQNYFDRRHVVVPDQSLKPEEKGAIGALGQNRQAPYYLQTLEALGAAPTNSR